MESGAIYEDNILENKKKDRDNNCAYGIDNSDLSELFIVLGFVICMSHNVSILDL